MCAVTPKAQGAVCPMPGVFACFLGTHTSVLISISYSPTSCFHLLPHCTCACTHVHTLIYTDIHTGTHIYTYTRTHVYTHIHICTHIPTQTHRHRHTCRDFFGEVGERNSFWPLLWAAEGLLPAIKPSYYEQGPCHWCVGTEVR